MTSTIILNKLPGMLPLLGRSAITRKPKTKNPVFPELRFEVKGVETKAKKLGSYNEVCGFGSDTSKLSVTYPHAPIFALHLSLMLHKDFPFAPMGLLHMRNSITQHRAIQVGERMDIAAFLSGSRRTDKGWEFDISSEVRVGEELVWEETGVFLYRAPQKGAKKNPPPEPETFASVKAIELPSGLGRAYAKVSGDYNPIHLTNPTAKLLGFKKMVIHGMWSKTRCVSALVDGIDSEALQIDCEFKTPIFLPATVALHYSEDQGGYRFALRNQAGTRPHVVGSIKPL